MTVDEHARTARSFLEQADREFEIGDELQGSEKMWGAARHAVAAVAQERGWDFGKHGAIRSAVRRLADEREDAMLDAGFLAARQFHANFSHGFMLEDDIERGRVIVRRFVDQVLALNDLDGENGR